MDEQNFKTPDWLEPAIAQGHRMEPDPPNSSRSAIAKIKLSARGRELLVLSPRWTCTRCGCAALNNGGNIYGSATDRRCHLS